MHLKDLKQKTPADLVAQAEEMGIEGASTMRKQDLMFSILKVRAESGAEINGQGTIEVLNDGFGFLRSPEANYLAGPDDVYVSQEVVSRMLRRMVGGGPGAGIDRLSDRELEVFQWIGHGLSVGEIAEKLKVSPKTIETYRAHIKEKLGLASASDVLRVAVTWLEQKT